MATGNGWVAFFLDGRERWRIEAGRFGGNPVLASSVEAGRIRLSLTGAVYPGTRVPASVFADITRSREGWRLRLRHGALVEDAELPFERWLSGQAPVRGRASPWNRGAPFGATCIHIASGAPVEFSPDWSLRTTHPGSLELDALEGGAPFSTLSLSLLERGAPSLMAGAPIRRSLLTIDRGAVQWPIWQTLRNIAIGRLAWRKNPFDRLMLESGEDGGGLRSALVAFSPAGSEGLAFLPGGGRDSNGNPFTLPLRGPQFAMALDPSGNQSAITASYDRRPRWLHGKGLALLVGGSAGEVPFMAQKMGQRPARVVCSPALLAYHIPLAGAVVDSVATPLGTSINLSAVSAGGSGDPEARPIETLRPGILSVSVVRPEDMLALRFEFLNLTLDTINPRAARLVRADASKPAIVLVHFPPQSLGERAFFESESPGGPGDETPILSAPAKARLAGPSRLAFRVNDDVASIPFTLEGLLDWSQMSPNVAASARPRPELKQRLASGSRIKPVDPRARVIDPRLLDPSPVDARIAAPAVLAVVPKIAAPGTTETAIESPWQLVVSPSSLGAWAHSAGAVKHKDLTELWHTRLAVRSAEGAVDEADDYQRILRAIWTPSFVAASKPDPNSLGPFRMALRPRHRYDIVRLTSDYTVPGYNPDPIQVDGFTLTALGAWMDTRGAWKFTSAIGNTVEWRQRSTMGRDHFVRVVEQGYLHPFGHRAAKVTVTERKFQAAQVGPLAGSQAAFQRQREFIVVRQQDRTYPLPGQPSEGRKMPFKLVRLTTLTTPSLNPSDLPPSVVSGGGGAFWPHVGGSPFPFHLVGEDSDGQRSEFTAPLVFVPGDVAVGDASGLSAVQSSYNAGDIDRRRRSFNGSKIAYAESSDDKPGDTTLETAQLTFEGLSPEPTDADVGFDQPRFFPAVKEADVRLPAVEQITGKNAPVTIEIHSAYQAAGTGAGNPAAVFARILNTVNVAFGADRSGGVVTPNIKIDGLSRNLGPVGGDVSKLLPGAPGAGFDPKAFFQGAQARILGAMDLQDIVGAITLPELASGSDAAPKLTNRPIYPMVSGKEDSSKPPVAVETRLFWKPKVQSDPLEIFKVNPGGKTTALAVEAKVLTRLDSPQEPEFSTVGTLTNFRMDLIANVLSFLIIDFNELKFSAKTGEKPDVTANIGDVQFTGPLAFVNTLQSYLKSGDSGPSVDVTADGVNAGYTLGIPSIAVGMFSLQNISLSAELNLPFTGKPVRARFALCDRENPFLLTVSMFGGGGFFRIGTGLDGIESFEAALEFGASVSLDIGVASGGVHVKAGIYFSMEVDAAVLTGYISLGGELCVLGLITISVEFYMGLTYEFATDKVWGQATLTVNIDVVLFSKSISMTVERQFAGPSGDPTFADLVDEAAWTGYAAAFAA